MREHPLFFFFFMAYAFSWIILIPYVLSAWGIIAGDFTFIFALHTFGPALAAIIMTSVIEGKAGLLRLWSRIRQWRAGWQWYLFILLGIPALLLIGIIIQPRALASFHRLPPLLFSAVYYLVNFVLVFFLGGPLGEEIGWRGFALPRMQPRYGPLWGTMLLGVLWVFWHLADFLTPVHGGFLTNFPIFFLEVMALVIIFTWVFNHTRGSIFTAILLHASVDTPELALVPLFLVVDQTSLTLGGLIGFGVPALLILILTRGRLGYQPLPSPQSFEP
jgi:membrane protease YdiL (CAAX protease family)